ncbi:RNA pseudouridine synthase [Lachnospiraceae bacterium]|uniref:RluA family pseudouridine synthase n=1 Tax=Extibacter sp. GGCC_0201 TaxID=2731209 RepID=UPI001AA135C2|nr:RNA pseudouridine synthase [Extibacter sp. GGCC_0201]MBO1720897.1 RNA pseudouridine synthase [Extibacter sp. GGCC_0201]BDF32045.1 RNA pseudouridine synthase [Lachnospiraceae bacterium]BDF36058.1 RNA pseudouridine synthase [Lachnospiraceae bacterium]
MKINHLDILFEDKYIIVCVKPHGVATQSKSTAVQDMESMLKTHIFSYRPQNGEPYLAIIHRLDQPVKGILVFAKTPLAARELNRQMQNDCFDKYYRALVDGIPPGKEGTLENYMLKDGRTNTSSICAREAPGAKLARLHYKIVEEGQGYFKTGHTETSWGRGKSQFPPSPTELDIRLDTGRHHQIRVQLANLGCPIIGDTKYNPKALDAVGLQHIHLCAYRLSFPHPKTGRKMTFSLL